MGPNDAVRLEENKAERAAEKLQKVENNRKLSFEELKEKKFAEKYGEPKKMTEDEAMLEWIDLNKQLQRDREGNPFRDNVTGGDKFKHMLWQNPLIPIGK